MGQGNSDGSRKGSGAQAAALRRLRIALRVGGSGELWGLALGVGLTVALATAALWMTDGGGKPVRTYGRVLGISLTETDEGSFPVARVWVDDRETLVRVPRETTCKVGDAIELMRARGLIGDRYRMGVRGCSAWFAVRGTTTGFGPEWSCAGGRRGINGPGVCVR